VDEIRAEQGMMGRRVADRGVWERLGVDKSRPQGACEEEPADRGIQG